MARAVDILVSKLDGAGLGFTVASSNAPDAHTLAALQARTGELNASLAPAPAADVSTTLTRFLATFDTVRGSPDEAQRLLDLHVAVLAGLPLWAIRQACFDWSRGVVPDSKPQFVPAPGELRRIALAKVAPFGAERHAIAKVLSARVVDDPTPEARQTALERWEAMRPHILSARPANEAPRPDAEAPLKPLSHDERMAVLADKHAARTVTASPFLLANLEQRGLIRKAEKAA